VTVKARRRLRDVVARSGPARWQATRDDLAFRYLRGDGIEIGALYHPQRVPSSARVRYVDLATADELLATIPATTWVHPVDVIDDGARLEKFADASLDFVMAHHVLEHVEDPIAALHTFLRVVRPGGIVFLSLPDGRFSFDRDRERTSVEHVLRDHRDGPEVSRAAHHDEWSRYIDGNKTAAEYEAEGAHHHFHVWELQTFVELLLAIELPVTLEAAIATEPEFSVVLRKR
jgi:predicted SAM-dependent methyltransferase